jgi:hypothetical protein
MASHHEDLLKGQDKTKSQERKRDKSLDSTETDLTNESSVKKRDLKKMRKEKKTKKKTTHNH